MRVANLTSKLNLNDNPPGSINQALRMLTDETELHPVATPDLEEPDRPVADLREHDHQGLDDHDEVGTNGPDRRIQQGEGDRHQPLNGQQSLFGEPPTLRGELEEEEPEEPRRTRKSVLDGIHSSEQWTKFIEHMNNFVCLIENHGGVSECIDNWDAEEIPFVEENLKRFRDRFSQWIAQLERRIA